MCQSIQLLQFLLNNLFLMIEDIMTNEQKLDEIYQIIKAQESRAIRARWFRLFKWIIILALVYYISQNP